ncbi:8-oxo-dGTP diphosphatase [Streptococcus sp. S784/96/1]|uniref:8-oxo-dGTP diphosphatase n=1 Tax=Streptococcus sp. S784/96/1 TaxID=2653499 RepID=UPI0013894D06|nr:8-oxo-dGTP diphosphatase [Streptococcus sp. S784/96/1]
MPRSEEVILTNMCMIENERGEVVMQIRNPDRYIWDGAAFPGGHVEKGESLHEAVVREVYEETGLTIKNPVLVGIKHFHTLGDGVRYLVFLYKATEFLGELQSSEEGEVKWIAKSEFNNIDLADSMDDIIPFYEEKNASELFYLRDVNDILQRQFL